MSSSEVHAAGTYASTFHPVKQKISVILALTLWMGVFFIAASLLLVSFVHLQKPWALFLLSTMFVLTIVPVNENSGWGKSLARWISATVPLHFPLKVIVEDKDAINDAKAHIIAFEPHSVWPLGVIAFAEGSNCVPFQRVRVLGSSALDYVPLCRHLWKWLGMAAVSRKTFIRLLSEGTSCVVVPGGVQECLHMNPLQEVLFLKKRLGFIKVAVLTGSPIVPAFCFGQRDTYKYWFPRQRWFQNISRSLKFSPLIYWGMWGGPLPIPKPMTVVIGTPIEVPRLNDPTERDLKELQEKFLEAMCGLYNKYRDECGSVGVDLVIV